MVRGGSVVQCCMAWCIAAKCGVVHCGVVWYAIEKKHCWALLKTKLQRKTQTFLPPLPFALPAVACEATALASSLSFCSTFWQIADGDDGDGKNSDKFLKHKNINL